MIIKMSNMGLKQLENQQVEKISLVKIIGHLNHKQKSLLSAYTAHWLQIESKNLKEISGFKS